jgi:hypothetical protein
MADSKTSRAKFKCKVVTIYEDSKEISLSAVTGSSEENKNFWNYTPSGELKMQIDGPASEMFVPGKEYYIDFSVCE